MAKKQPHKNVFEGYRVCVIIPTFNNRQTVVRVINDVLRYTPDVIVVNDGSTDGTEGLLNEIDGIDVIGYAQNKGKGYAIRQGFRRALARRFDYAVTIDADGQHFAADLQVFADQLKKTPDALIIGARNIHAAGMPSKNTFANKFSNFWFWVETGQKLPDTQSGYRLYPVKLYQNSAFFTEKYEFEVEVLVRSAWSGIKMVSVPVRVDYPEDRVTHFRPLPDFSRISMLNTVLVLVTFLYIVPRNAFRYLTHNKATVIIREQLRLHNENNAKVSLALGFGVFMGIAPIWGFQMLTAAFLAHFMRLNKILVLVASNISLPPLVPFIIYVSYKTGGIVLNNPEVITRETLLQLKQQIIDGRFYDTFQALGYSIYQYVVGSLVFGLGLGALVALVAFVLMKTTQWIKS